MTSSRIDAGDGLPLTLPAVLRRHCAERGGHGLLATDRHRLTYAEAEAWSARIAKGFLAAGASKGTHIGLLLPNDGEFVVCMLAAARIGAVVLPFSTLSTPDEIRQLLIQSDTAMLVAASAYRDRSFADILEKAFGGLDVAEGQPIHLAEAPWLRRIWIAGANEDAPWSLAALERDGQSIPDEQLKAAEASVRPADRFVIIHTSGSTSTPKGVIHQHGQLIRHISNINEIRSLTDKDVMFATSPWFWIAGFAFGLLGVILAGARMVCSNAQDAVAVLDLIEQERPNTTNGYYPAVNWLADSPEFAKRDLSFIRSGNLWPILAEDVRPSDPSYRHDIYGMSEVGSALSLSADESDQPEHLRGAAGQICPGFEARVVDPETGADCAPGEIGELWLRGPLMMEGYYGRARSETFAPDGWWKSSDAVAIDAEGFVFLKGRLGNMIKTAGANVAPREVEAVLSELTGKLSMVVGIPDADRGQAVIGVVFSERKGAIDPEALRARLREKLSSYKVPRRILDLTQDEMPTLSSGKVDMTKLLELVERLCRDQT